MTEPGDRLKSAMEECERLRAENARLRSLLVAHDITFGLPEENSCARPPADTATISKGSTPDQKLALFRSLFRGREDVYALRWEKGEKHGYAPAADMDWRSINAAPLERRKEVARKTRSLRLLTDAAIRDHLEGKVTIGIYPLLPDETCSLLAVDFDKSGWQPDAAAFLAVCHRFNVPQHSSGRDLATEDTSGSSSIGRYWRPTRAGSALRF